MWYVIIAIVLFVIYKFFTAVAEDNEHTILYPFNEQYKVFLDEIAKKTFDGDYRLSKKADYLFLMDQKDSNHKILFKYAMGSIDVTWKFGSPNNSLEIPYTFNNVKNVDETGQQLMAKNLVSHVTDKIRTKYSPMLERKIPVEPELEFVSESTDKMMGHHKRIIIATLLTMASADGKVEMNELKTIFSQRERFSFSIEEFKRILEYYTANIREAAQDAKRINEIPHQYRKAVIVSLAEIAAADGQLHDNESDYIMDVSEKMDLDFVETVKILQNGQANS